MDTAIENIRIRPLIPEDRDGVYTFFHNLGEEGTYFFNRNGGNERGTYQYLDGARPDHIFWAAVADTPEGEEIVEDPGEELPPDFVCPLCKHGTDFFEPLS